MSGTACEATTKMHFDYEPRSDEWSDDNSEDRAAGVKLTLQVVAVVIGTIALGIVLTPFLTGYKPMVSQRLILPGQTFVTEEHGDLGANSRGSLVCTYFTGRRFVQRVYWHSPENLYGKANCPLIQED